MVIVTRIHCVNLTFFQTTQKQVEEETRKMATKKMDGNERFSVFFVLFLLKNAKDEKCASGHESIRYGGWRV